MTNHETLWAREGDHAREFWAEGHWSPFASFYSDCYRGPTARVFLHGFDFRVESENGTKRMVKVRKKKEAS